MSDNAGLQILRCILLLGVAPATTVSLTATPSIDEPRFLHVGSPSVPHVAPGLPAVGPDTIAACTPSHPSVVTSDSVRVHIAVAPDSPSYRYTFTATHGRVAGQGHDVWWILSDAPRGLDTLTVRIDRSGRAVAACQVQVAVRLSKVVRGDADYVARAVLLPRQREDTGYVRYNYLLFGVRPTTAAQATYRRAVEEYVRQLESISAYTDELASRNIRQRQLVLTFVPLKDSVPERGPDSVKVTAILRQYDYARARAWLAKLPGTHQRGPYLVSVGAPLGASAHPRGPVLVQDLSAVSEGIVGDWVAEFLNQSAQRGTDPQWNAGSWALRLRTGMALLAQAAEPIAGGIEQWRNLIGKWITADSRP